MPDKKFDLGEYVEVKDRITKFYELYGNGRLVTGEVTLTSEPDGKPRVMVQALAYRSPDDEHPGVGYSWMELPGTTSYTKGSELENTETSAWGRAIASLGILNDKSIASAQEIANKQEGAGSAGTSAKGADGPPAPHEPLIGEVEVGKPPVDMQVRQTPDGPAYGFKLKVGAKGYQALAIGPLAEALSVAGLTVGDRVQVTGVIEMVPWDKDGKKMPPFARVAMSRISTLDWVLPAPEAASLPMWEPTPEEKDAIILAELDEVGAR